MASTPIQYLSASSFILNLTKFNKVLSTLFYDLRVKASAGGIFCKFATGNVNYKNNTIYGVMQCSPDLSEIDCSNCLVDAC